MNQATHARDQGIHDDDDALPTCKCGTDRTRREATPEREYSLLGTLYALWGGTAIPTIVRFRCVHCGVVFDHTTDRAEMRAYII